MTADGGTDSGRSASSGGDTVTVGFALPTSGVYGALGEELLDGFEFRIGTGRGGDLGGFDVEVVVGDTAADPERGRRVAEDLIENEGIDVLSGPISSGVAEQMMAVAQDHAGEVVWLNPHAGDCDLVTDHRFPYHVRTGFNSYQVSSPMADHVIENIGEEVAVAFADYKFGRQTSRFFGERLAALGGSVVTEIRAPFGTDDHAAVLEEIEGADADAVWAFFAGTDAESFVTGYADRGLKDDLPLVGIGASLASPETFPAIGDAALGVRTSFHYTRARDNDANRAFLEDLAAETGTVPNYTHVEGHDAAVALERALKGAGSADPEALVAELNGLVIEESPRGTIRISEDTHDIVQDVDIRVARSGDGDVPSNDILEPFEDVVGPAAYADVSFEE